MNRLHYVGYVLSVAFCVLVTFLAFGEALNFDKNKTTSFTESDCENYVSFSYGAKRVNGDTIFVAHFKIANETDRTLKNIKVYGRANAKESIYEISELKSREIQYIEMELKCIRTSDPNAWVNIALEFWAEGDIV